MSRSVHLLDANVLIALTSKEHASHSKVMSWWQGRGRTPFATCPVTEGALVRFHARLSEASGVQLAKAILRSIEQLRHHQFWASDLPFSSLPERGLRGHKQVTDAYLVAITRARKGRLATLDEALSAWHPDACLLIR